MSTFPHIFRLCMNKENSYHYPCQGLIFVWMKQSNAYTLTEEVQPAALFLKHQIYNCAALKKNLNTIPPKEMINSNKHNILTINGDDAESLITFPSCIKMLYLPGQ